MSYQNTALLYHPKTLKAFRFLLKAAMARRLVTYEELGAAVGLPCFSVALRDRLGEISCCTFRKYGILLTAIVVGKHAGMPGAGFGWLREACGIKLQPNQTELEFWARSMADVFKFGDRVIDVIGNPKSDFAMAGESSSEKGLSYAL